MTGLDISEYEALLTGFWLTDLANTAAYLYQNLPDVNWAGFYLSDGSKLRLGPFCGRPACTEIQFGRGVCGASFLDRKTLIVEDVDEFPGHIRCDSVSKSELVVPIRVGEEWVGVLDIDSPRVGRFGAAEKQSVELLIAKLEIKLLRTYPSLRGP